MATSNFQQRFIDGLKEYGLTIEDIKNWKYCGGNHEQHLRYYKLCFPKSKKTPEPVYQCVCKHPIIENCYITDGQKNVLILGNCCIKRFIEKSGRTCSNCEQPHKNRKNNLCNKCREKDQGSCSICKKPCLKASYKYCRECYFNR